MLKYLICGAVALGAFTTVQGASATGVIVNGQSYSGGSITVPYGYGTAGAVNNGYCCGDVPLVDTGVVVSGAQPQAAPIYSAPTYSTSQPVVSNEVIYLDPPQQTVTYSQPVTTHQIDIVPAAAAAAPVVAAPVAYAPRRHARRGWGSQVYVGARGGWTGIRDNDFNYIGGSVDSDFDDGWNISGVVGWRGRVHRGIGYRFEAELGYLNADVDRLGGTSDIDGDANVVYGFVNAYTDIPLAHRVNAVLGGGVGLGRVEYDGFDARVFDNDQNRQRVFDDSDNAFGYHLDAGLSYDVTDQLSLEAMYRYMSFIDAELEATNGAQTEIDLDSHNVTIGARYGF